MVFNATFNNISVISWRDVLDTTFSQWFSSGTPVSSTNKTDRHDITNIVESGVKHHITNSIQMRGRCLFC
jgi:hypothetical protein